jgi:hypothetical protein
VTEERRKHVGGRGKEEVEGVRRRKKRRRRREGK